MSAFDLKRVPLDKLRESLARKTDPSDDFPTDPLLQQPPPFRSKLNRFLEDEGPYYTGDDVRRWMGEYYDFSPEWTTD